MKEELSKIEKLNKKRASGRAYYHRNKDKAKHYRQTHKIENGKKAKEYYKLNSERMKARSIQYHKDNKDKVGASDRKLKKGEYNRERYRRDPEEKKLYYQKNKKHCSEANKRRYKERSADPILAEKERLRKKEYRENNKEKRNARERERYARPECALINNMRSRIWNALKKNKKSAKTIVLLGCSYEELQEYMESKWTTDMSWNNHGKKGWEIDYIAPCTTFDLRIEENQRKCFHYTNLQPLWASSEIAIAHGEPKNYIGNQDKNNRLIWGGCRANESVF